MQSLSPLSLSKNSHRLDNDAREDHLFRSLDLENTGSVRRYELERALLESGLEVDDPRLAESLAELESTTPPTPGNPKTERAIPHDEFYQVLRPNIVLIERALQGNLIIPDFTHFCEEIDRIYAKVKENDSGETASYIPQLAAKGEEADQFGAALCTIDGQRHTMGNADVLFSIQSCSKPINYCMALELHGSKFVHQHVGREPSGVGFNELTLDKENRPHNPMVNAGAIMSCALISLLENQSARTGIEKRDWAGKRFDAVLDCWESLAGGARPQYSNSIYLSERKTADRNFALAYFMRETGAFPEGIDLHDVLDFYFQCCAIQSTTKHLSVVAATLANGGICPLTGKRVFRTETVQHCLSMMSSCGMYDFSGEFNFRVGLPAKSGVSGVVMTVVPGVMGLCTWSPKLDEVGNSVRGVEFCQRLVRSFNFHSFANLTRNHLTRDPRMSRVAQKAQRINELIWAASKGDLSAIQHRSSMGGRFNEPDYDHRTPLHLAAAEGQEVIVRWFIEQYRQKKINTISPRDRWGGTPVDDAVYHGHKTIVGLLQDAGAKTGDRIIDENEVEESVAQRAPSKNSGCDELIWAASLGDMRHIRRLVARGADFNSADYDLRTPLHLAASEGHVEVARYLLDQGSDRDAQDRWGGTPLRDAHRHGHMEVANLLEGKLDSTKCNPLNGFYNTPSRPLNGILLLR